MAIIITFLASLTILSSLLVIFSSVTPTSSWLVLLISLLGTLIIKKINKQINNETIEQLNNYNNTKSYILHTTFYMLLCVAIFLFYSHYQSTGSSPLVWNILPGWFLPVLLVLFVIYTLFALSRKTKKQKNNETKKQKKPSSQTPIWDPNNKQQTTKRSFDFFFSFLNSNVRWNDVTIFLSFPIIFLILPILFPLGTDYDPFVHRAAEHTIVEQGSISPRTFLYSGEYGLVSILSTVTHIPVKAVNIWLLPLLCLIVLPSILKKTFNYDLVLITFFLLPFSLLTTTVPQGLGIFFLFILLLLHFRRSKEIGSEQLLNGNMSEPVLTRGGTKDLGESESGRSFDASSKEASLAGENWFRFNNYFFYFLLALASFLSHPFTGIAAFVFLGWLILTRTLTPPVSPPYQGGVKGGVVQLLNYPVTKLLLSTFYFLLSTLLLPLALYLNNYLPSQFSISSISLNPEALSALKSVFDFGWIRYTDPLSFVYFFGKNYEFFFFLIILFPVLSLVRKGRERRFSHPPLFEQVLNSEGRQGMSAVQNGSPKANASLAEENPPFTTHSFIPYLFSFLSIFISSLLILFFLQPNVTSAEHIQLFTRVFSISLVFLWPLFLQGILLISQPASTAKRGEQTTNNKKQKNLFTVYCLLLAVLTVSNIYLQFPHSDRFEAHKGFLVSQDDITTVQKIESFAQKPYLVLANQTVGAAALDQFGFATYVNKQSTVNSQQNKNVILSLSKDFKNEKQYFYSIPVSSRAQQYYLQMLKNPSQELINEIFQTYEIKELYLILNDYWKNSRIISRELSKIADETLTVGGNTVFKFFYTK